MIRSVIPPAWRSLVSECAPERTHISRFDCLRRHRMILSERLVGERLPFVYLRGRNHHPLSKHLAPAGRIEKMRAGNGQRAPMCIRIGQLEHQPRPGQTEHDLPGALHARHPEHLRGACVVVPGANRVDDVVVTVAFPVTVAHEATIRLPAPGFSLAPGAVRRTFFSDVRRQVEAWRLDARQA